MHLPFLHKKQEEPTHFESLKNKWEGKYKSLQEKLWANHGDVLHWFINSSRQWYVGTLAGLVMLSMPGVSTAADGPLAVKEKPFKDLNKDTVFILDLLRFVPQQVRPLDADEANNIAGVLTQHMGFKVSASLQGKQLNTSYGYIGAEQHLARFPGDSMNTHLDSSEDQNLYYNSGMAPGLGAWGYFSRTRDSMTAEDNLREKYYIAVQTFISPGYQEHVAEYNAFFKYRKMLVVNPQNGKAIVTVIGDAGPSPWTGKQFGGSPEVMHYLERVDGSQKGPVLVYFIDDPENKVPLGPIAIGL